MDSILQPQTTHGEMRAEDELWMALTSAQYQNTPQFSESSDFFTINKRAVHAKLLDLKLEFKEVILRRTYKKKCRIFNFVFWESVHI